MSKKYAVEMCAGRSLCGASSLPSVRMGELFGECLGWMGDHTDSSFDDNACVLLNNKGEMLGTRVNGVVSSELRKIEGGTDANGRWAKVLALAPKVRGCVIRTDPRLCSCIACIAFLSTRGLFCLESAGSLSQLENLVVATSSLTETLNTTCSSPVRVT